MKFFLFLKGMQDSTAIPNQNKIDKGSASRAKNMTASMDGPAEMKKKLMRMVNGFGCQSAAFIKIRFAQGDSNKCFTENIFFL